MDSFFELVYNRVKQIPKGKVATYGQIARLCGYPRNARVVGYALHSNPDPENIPCHRVIFADGRLTDGFAFGGKEGHKLCLERDGVVVRDDYTVDLSVYGYFI